MSRYHELQLNKKIIHPHIEDDRYLKSLEEEYNVSKASITNWVKKFR